MKQTELWQNVMVWQRRKRQCNFKPTGSTCHSIIFIVSVSISRFFFFITLFTFSFPFVLFFCFWRSNTISTSFHWLTLMRHLPRPSFAHFTRCSGCFKSVLATWLHSQFASFFFLFAATLSAKSMSQEAYKLHYMNSKSKLFYCTKLHCCALQKPHCAFIYKQRLQIDINLVFS